MKDKLVVKQKTIEDYLAVILFVGLSGAIPFFKLYIIWFTVALAYGIVIYSYRSGKQFKIPMYLVKVYFIFIVSCLLNFRSGISFQKLLQIFAYYLVGFFLVATLEKEDFKRIYSNIIVAEAGISVCIWILQLLNLVDSRTETILGFTYKHFLYNSIFASRNSGIFWEPGAFQFFLNLGLIFVFESEGSIKNYRIKQIILTVAVLSTQSTTGYLILALIYIYYVAINNAKRMNTSQRIKYIISVAAVCVVAIYVLSSNTVQSKFTNDNYSYRTRSVTWEVSSKMILDKPIIGYGYDSVYYNSTYQSLGSRSQHNSSGLLLFTCYLGIPLMGCYLYMMYKSIKAMKFKMHPIWLSVILLLVFNSECFFTYPIIMYFFSGLNKRIGGANS